LLKKKEILVVGKHPEIMKVILRLINNKPQLNGNIALSAEEAIEKSHTVQPDLVLLGAGLTTDESQQLRSYFTMPVVQHYGGGSGLLFAEIYQALGIDL
jgi:chemotaxis response regulator CheB